MSYLFIFFGIFIGILIERYIFVIFDLLIEIFQYKQSNKATNYQLQAKEAVIIFERKYPELNKNSQELTPAIGFNYVDSNDLYENDEEDEDCCNNKRKIKYRK